MWGSWTFNVEEDLFVADKVRRRTFQLAAWPLGSELKCKMRYQFLLWLIAAWNLFHGSHLRKWVTGTCACTQLRQAIYFVITLMSDPAVVRYWVPCCRSGPALLPPMVILARHVDPNEPHLASLCTSSSSSSASLCHHLPTSTHFSLPKYM
jgi:hypothetical protein